MYHQRPLAEGTRRWRNQLDDPKNHSNDDRHAEGLWNDGPAVPVTAQRSIHRGGGRSIDQQFANGRLSNDGFARH